MAKLAQNYYIAFIITIIFASFFIITHGLIPIRTKRGISRRELSVIAPHPSS